MSYRRKRSISKTLKDYMVPIIWGIIVLLLLVNVFSWDSTAETERQISAEENMTSFNVSLYGDNTEAYVVYTGGNRKLIESDLSLYKGEKVVVKEGNVTIGSAMIGNFILGRWWEFSYNEDGSFGHTSSDLWIRSDGDMKVQMRYAHLNIEAGSVLSLTQNEIQSVVYLLQGSVDVQNLAGKSTVLAPGGKIVVSRSDASDDDIDLSLQKTQIDDYWKGSDWFIRNKGLQYLQGTSTDSGTGETATPTTPSSKLVTLENIQDEARVSGATLDVRGSYSEDAVKKISINGVDATVNTAEKSFVVEGVDTSKKENDLVVKAYSDDDIILGKYVYTVYYDAAKVESTSLFKVENFSLDSTKFKFVSPKTNPYTTSAAMVTIEGMVPTGTVEKIIVNDFQLQKFPKYGTYWKYHANVDWGNLKEGLNIYKIDYYGKWGAKLHTNAFTIVKQAKAKPVVVPPKVETKTMSDEV